MSRYSKCFDALTLVVWSVFHTIAPLNFFDFNSKLVENNSNNFDVASGAAKQHAQRVMPAAKYPVFGVALLIDYPFTNEPTYEHTTGDHRFIE